MYQYMVSGFWYFIRSIVMAVIIYTIYSVILMITKKRNFKEVHSLPKAKMFFEVMLMIYVCAILKITGIIGMSLYLDISVASLGYMFKIPFVEASIKMIILNVMLFIPYGFLVPLAFPSSKLNWKRALLIGFCSTLCIEVLQVFSGRLCEVDDLIANTCGFLIGFLIYQAFKEIGSKELRKKGILHLICICVITGVSLFLLSFVANGDKEQKELDEYYNGINNDEAISSICEYTVYNNGKEFDALQDLSIDWEMWYIGMGMNIDNQSRGYEYQNDITTIEEILEQENDVTYIEIVFEEPQSFRFYNNRDWYIEDVLHLVYCVEDGTLWYGVEENSLEYKAEYVDEEYPFSVDEDMIDEILEWMK